MSEASRAHGTKPRHNARRAHRLARRMPTDRPPLHHTDINTMEDSAGGAELTVAMLANTRKVVHMQLEPKLPLANFRALMEAATLGCMGVYENLKPVVHRCVEERVEARGTVNF